MKKKQYIVPMVETTQFGADVIMRAVGGDASLPNGDMNMAPRRKTEVF